MSCDRHAMSTMTTAQSSSSSPMAWWPGSPSKHIRRGRLYYSVYGPSRRQSVQHYLGHCCLYLALSLALLLALLLTSLLILVYLIPCPQIQPRSQPELTLTSATNQSTDLHLPSLFYQWKCPHTALYFIDDQTLNNTDIL